MKDIENTVDEAEVIRLLWEEAEKEEQETNDHQMCHEVSQDQDRGRLLSVLVYFGFLAGIEYPITDYTAEERNRAASLLEKYDCDSVEKKAAVAYLRAGGATLGGNTH